MAILVPVKCVFCGRFFRPVSRRQKHCSVSCSQKRRYAEKKSLGLCVTCQSDTGGGVRCVRCMNSLRAINRKWRNKKIADGLCVECNKDMLGEPLWYREGGATRCQECAIEVRNKTAAARRKLIAVGICSNCRKRKARRGRRSCEECRIKLNAANQRCRQRKREANCFL